MTGLWLEPASVADLTAALNEGRAVQYWAEVACEWRPSPVRSAEDFKRFGTGPTRYRVEV